jgi:hypothetical protein
MTSLMNDLLNSGMTTSLLPLLAQAEPDSLPVGDSVNTGSSLISLLIQFVIYCFISYCTQTFLKKLGYEKAWYAWVPIVSTYAILEAGEQQDPLIWTLIAIVPVIGLISLIKLIPAYIKICERLGKPPAILWTFLLCGLGAFIVPFVLAFT